MSTQHSSTLISPRQRAKLAADLSIGAGNFLHKLVSTADRALDAPLVWLDRAWTSPDGERFEHFSAQQLKRLADWYAGFYHALGVRPRDPVAVYTHSAIDLLLSYAALTGLGAIPVLINGGLPPEIVAGYVRRAEVVGLVTDEPRAAALRPLLVGGPSEIRFVRALEAIRGGERSDLPEWYPYEHAAHDPVLITHSSGTTGFPKAVLMQHQNFFSAIRYRMGMSVPEASKRILSALPGSHNSAITMAMFALLGGIPIALISTQNATAVLQEIERFKPTLVAGFSKTFTEMSEENLGAFELSSVQMWWNSGDAVHETHVRKLMAVGNHIRVGIGGVEVRPGSAFTDCLGSSEMGHSLFYNTHQPGEARFSRCIGRPFGFVEAAVLSETGAPLPPHQVGRLGVRSPTLSTGYWNDSALTWRSHLAGYWLTGDLVYRDDDGCFYHVDRLSDAIRTDEGVIYSLQVEELLMAKHPAIADCTVIGVPSVDGRRTEAWAFLEMRRDAADGAEAADWLHRANATLREHDLLPVARVVHVRHGELPTGVTGKVKKRELRERWREFAGSGDDAGAPGPS